MKAVGIMTHGGPEALEVLEVPDQDAGEGQIRIRNFACLLYTSPSPRDRQKSRMPSSA